MKPRATAGTTWRCSRSRTRSSSCCAAARTTTGPGASWTNTACRRAAPCCSRPAMARSIRPRWPTGSSPTACRCACSCSCTRSCGGTSLDAKPKKAVVLLSGGLDSATVLAIARSEGYQAYALSVSYGQRHAAELQAAERVAQRLGAVALQRMQVNLDAVGGSALTDRSIAVPETPGSGIPVTYVPARNTLFLSLALGWAEVLGATDLFIGVNAVDYSGYPDCRPEFVRAFEGLANLP